MPQGQPEPSAFSAAGMGIADILGRLSDARPVMEAIGQQIIAAAQLAFEEKRFGDFKWPAQYETAPAPWIHIAGATSDLSKGERVKGSRFAQSEAILRDSGALHNTLAVRTTSKNEVVVGSPEPYAKYHQWGSKHVGPAVQTVTDAMRKGLKREIRNAGPDNKAALGKLWHWFKKDHVETRVRQRPFLGVTDELEQEIRIAVVSFMEEGKI